MTASLLQGPAVVFGYVSKHAKLYKNVSCVRRTPTVWRGVISGSLKDLFFLTVLTLGQSPWSPAEDKTCALHIDLNCLTHEAINGKRSVAVKRLPKAMKVGALLVVTSQCFSREDVGEVVSNVNNIKWDTVGL